MKLWQLIHKEKQDKKQIAGKLNDGACGYCIGGLIIKAIDPQINIEHCLYEPVYSFCAKNNEKFIAEENAEYLHTNVKSLIEEFKKEYKKSGKVNLDILSLINDFSLYRNSPFTFDDFEQLFKELDI